MINTPIVSRSMTNEAEHRSRLADAINNILKGKLNNTSSVTLTANSASTTLTDTKIGINSVIIFMPTTANAAGAISSLYVSSTGNGTATLAHANTATTDRSFQYAVIG